MLCAEMFTSKATFDEYLARDKVLSYHEKSIFLCLRIGWCWGHIVFRFSVRGSVRRNVHLSIWMCVHTYVHDPVRLRLRHLYQVEFCSFIVRYPTVGASVYCGHISSFFLFLHKKTCCRCTLEAPQGYCLSGAMEYLNTLFNLITAHTPISALSRNFIGGVLFVCIFIKPYVAETHLNCIYLLMQYQWVATTYAKDL